MTPYDKGKLCALPWVFFVALLAHAQQPTPLSPTKGVVGTTIFRGQELTYTVRDGLAIHGGDIILGTAEEAAAAVPPQVGGPSQAATQRVRSNVDLWPGGVIPYVIDDDVANSEDILRAIEEWNSKTVISLVERAMEEDYVRFEAGEGVCAAHIGRKGGEQLIRLDETCDWRIVVHEIGHAIGLWHEHQRADRDRHLMVRWREVGICQDPFDLIAFAQVERPYDYASTMHYGRGPFGDLPWLDTIPPGISIVSAFAPAPLSSGDIDYVARLYGQPPTETTISTNPPGLEIVVDGVRYTTPATFDWAPGTTHQIEAPFVQIGNNPVLGDCCNYVDSVSREGERTRFVFGGWTDEGKRVHSVTAGSETTWYQANYIVQLHVASTSQPPEAGRAMIRPESPDGFYTVGAPVRVSAVANPGHHFVDWRGQWMPGSDRINWLPGASWNPALMYVGLNGRAPRISARFTAEPVVSIGMDGYAHRANVRDNRGKYVSLPINYSLADFRSKFASDNGTIEVAVADGLASSDIEPVPGFLRWSDGVVGDRYEENRIVHVVREVDVSDEGGELSTEWETHVPLFTRTSPSGYFEGGELKPFGRIDTYPPPLDDRKGSYWSDTDYYVQEASVDLTAVSLHPEYRFLGWSGDAHGTDETISLVMDGPKDVEAHFSYYPILQLGVPTSGRLSRSWPTWGYWIYVPFGATELAVDVDMDNPEVDAVLAVSDGGEISLDDDGRIRGAEFEAQLSNGTAQIVITRDSSPPLAVGPYFIRLVAPEAESTGTLSAAAVTNVQIRALPRAFTFVAPEGYDPAPQTFEFRNMADRALSYLILSDQDWLRVEPQEGILAAGEAVEVTAIVNSTGVVTDIHEGNLTIVDAEGMYEQGTDHLGKEGAFDIGRVVFSDRDVTSLPVTFALIPPN